MLIRLILSQLFSLNPCICSFKPRSIEVVTEIPNNIADAKRLQTDRGVKQRSIAEIRYQSNVRGK
jgi:hypothetical protein